MWVHARRRRGSQEVPPQDHRHPQNKQPEGNDEQLQNRERLHEKIIRLWGTDPSFTPTRPLPSGSINLFN